MAMIPLPHYEMFFGKNLKSEKKKWFGTLPSPPPPPPLCYFFSSFFSFFFSLFFLLSFLFFRAGAKFLGSRSSSETFCPPPPKQTPWRRPEMYWLNQICFKVIMLTRRELALSDGTLLISVMSQQYSCLMELYTNFLQNFTFHDFCIFPLLLYLVMLGLRWMCMHLWMNLIKRTIDIQEKLKIVKIYVYTMSMESCPLVISHILAKFHTERATYTTLHNHFS